MGLDSSSPAPRPRGPLRAVLVLGSALPLAIVALWGIGRSAGVPTGVAELAAHEIGLLVDHLSGEVRPLGRTGFHFFVPWFQEVLVFDRGTRTVRIGGSPPDAEPLVVRGRDGSSFSFTGLEVVIRPDPARLVTLAEHFGTSFEARRRFVVAAARSIVVEEFGRLAAQEATDADRLAAGRLAAKERLTERLAGRGIVLEELTTPKPRLEREVERSIDERKLAQAEVERLRVELERAIERRPRRIDALAAKESLQRAALDGEHRSKLLAARAEADGRIHAAEQARRTREAEAERKAAELLAQASWAREEAERAALRIAEEARAMEARGPLAVREALVESLARTPITIRLERQAEGVKP